MSRRSLRFHGRFLLPNLPQDNDVLNEAVFDPVPRRGEQPTLEQDRQGAMTAFDAYGARASMASKAG